MASKGGAAAAAAAAAALAAGDDYFDAVVIDNGSGMIKAGFSGDEAPRAEFPTIVGKPKSEQAALGAAKRDHYVGKEAHEKRGILHMTHPIEHGKVVSWEGIEKVWRHTCYSALRVSPEDHKILLTEPPSTSRADRERMTDVVFNQLGAPAMHVGVQSVLSLYACGRTTGIVIDSGHGVTHTVPVFEGYALPHAIMSVNMAGHDMTEQMHKLLNESGNPLAATLEYDTVRKIKEAKCYVALDFEEEMTNAAKAPVDDDYALPDGQKIRVGTQKFRCPEGLFKPSLLGIDADGLHDMAFKSIGKCDADVKRELYAAIVLCGGTTMYRGLPDRLEKEIGNLAPSAVKPKVVAPPERKHSAWIGGAIMSSLASFAPQWVTKAEFDEHGPGIVHHKCF